MEQMPLNKYISTSGYTSRRKAVELIKRGLVKVNNTKITEPGFKVEYDDKVSISGTVVKPIEEFVYIILNKPKNVVTTTHDPEGRIKVTDLVKKATRAKVYPIGRLDYQTTGVLLLTNDGALIQKLAHPKYEVRKTYVVTLNKPLSLENFENIKRGVRLEDGFIKPDNIEHGSKNTIVSIEIHSGKNRVVRRIFEHLGYEVWELDRIKFAGFDYGDLERGEWMLLNAKDIVL